jgi:hypothetical protein
MQAVVKAHDVTTPLFVYLAYQAVHAPSEVPELYKAQYGATITRNPNPNPNFNPNHQP